MQKAAWASNIRSKETRSLPVRISPSPYVVLSTKNDFRVNIFSRKKDLFWKKTDVPEGERPSNNVSPRLLAPSSKTNVEIKSESRTKGVLRESMLVLLSSGWVVIDVTRCLSVAFSSVTSLSGKWHRSKKPPWKCRILAAKRHRSATVL